MVKTVRNWIDIEIRKLNEFKQEYLKNVHKVENNFEHYSYIKDSTGYKLTYDYSEIGTRLTEKEFLKYLEFTNETLSFMDKLYKE